MGKAEVFTVAEVAAKLRIGRNSAFAAVKAGEIPSVRIGRRILIPRAALDRLLDNPRIVASTEAEQKASEPLMARIAPALKQLRDLVRAE